MIRLVVNDRLYQTDAPGDTPLLWVLRDELGLTGTKFGCGIAACGACTVHVDGMAMRSCQLTLADLDGPVTTIEGLARDGRLSPLQEAWEAHQVAQCGYCQSGQIMQAADLLAHDPDPDDATIDAVMSGNLCRCGTYMALRAAIHDAAQRLRARKGTTDDSRPDGGEG